MKKVVMARNKIVKQKKQKKLVSTIHLRTNNSKIKLS